MTLIAETMILDFGIVRVLVALAMFASATFFDLRKREVSDFLWIPFAAAAAILYLFDFPSSFDEGILILASMAITAAIAYGIYWSGLFGGADMLALITFSGIMPVFDGTIFSGWPALTFHKFAPIIVLTNAIIFSLVYVIFNVVRNVVDYSRFSSRLFDGLEHEPAMKKIFAMIVGHKSMNPKFDFPIEKIVEGRREFDFALRDAETAEYEVRKEVWVMSGIPYLVYFAAGFIMMILVGDLLAMIFAGFLAN
jgi:archaeal preflagellin peptidase FlaK